MIYVLIILACIAAVFLSGLANNDKSHATAQQPHALPKRPPLTDAEREAIRQADDVFDWNTHNAIVDATYAGPLPEHVAFNLWTNLYPNIYHTKIAGINFRRGIKNLAGTYFDCTIQADPKNRHDKNAIKILHTDGRHLGFIPADETDAIRQFLNNCLPYTLCRAHIDEFEEYDEETERDRTLLYGVINIHRSFSSPSNVSPHP